jgi:hypothetical protein
MVKFFNTAGPVNPVDHYCLPPLARLRMHDVQALIAQKKYFVLHAPRQTGKTSCMLALRDHLNAEGTYFCVYTNVEGAQGMRERVSEAVRLIVQEIADRAEDLGDAEARQVFGSLVGQRGHELSLSQFLSKWCEKLSRPLVLILDEIDSLVGDTLISVLRQLRSGYDRRPARFPQTVIACGVRDVRDYRLRINEGKEVITGGSAFNIKAESLRLGDFRRQDVEALYGQHTDATGQVFEENALALAWELTCGQPWLVNALAYETCFRMEAGRDRRRPITSEMLQEAKEVLIERRETHLDQLADKLMEERVRRVVEALLVGAGQPKHLPADDIDYVEDLGLIRRKPSLAIANPIYREVVPRELTRVTQETIAHEVAWYVTAEGRLDLEKLLAAFQQFFREHSEHWVERFDYREAGPQLLLQAFLQRIVNGGGRIEREYGLGRGRTDLLVLWPWKGGVEKTVIELKIAHGGVARTLAQGLEQTVAYQDRVGGSEAHLVIFDRDPEKPWSEKIYRRAETFQSRRVTVWGM